MPTALDVDILKIRQYFLLIHYVSILPQPSQTRIIIIIIQPSTKNNKIAVKKLRQNWAYISLR